VRALLRRTTGGAVKDKTIQVGDLVIYTETYTVTKKNKPVHLSATEFKLLLFLAERRGRVFSRDMLLDAVWKDEAFIEPRTVDVHIRRLRTAIEDDPAEPVFVKTRRGVGYYVE
jgi:DNA-binding response OmpR family regulator